MRMLNAATISAGWSVGFAASSGGTEVARTPLQHNPSDRRSFPLTEDLAEPTSSDQTFAGGSVLVWNQLGTVWPAVNWEAQYSAALKHIGSRGCLLLSTD